MNELSFSSYVWKIKKEKREAPALTSLILRTLFCCCYCYCFFFYLGFLSRIFTDHRTAVERGGHSINSSLPLLPASKTLRHQPGDYCRELTSPHSQQPGSNREPLLSERKSLATRILCRNVLFANMRNQKILPIPIQRNFKMKFQNYV